MSEWETGYFTTIVKIKFAFRRRTTVTSCIHIIIRGVLVDVAFKGVSVEPDFEDIESSYGMKVCETLNYDPLEIFIGSIFAFIFMLNFNCRFFHLGHSN